MQLLLIFGIVVAIGAVLFALQNNVPVTVAFLLWRFDSTLAVVLLAALGLGAFIAALVSTPAVTRAEFVKGRNCLFHALPATPADSGVQQVKLFLLRRISSCQRERDASYLRFGKTSNVGEVGYRVVTNLVVYWRRRQLAHSQSLERLFCNLQRLNAFAHGAISHLFGGHQTAGSFSHIALPACRESC